MKLKKCLKEKKKKLIRFWDNCMRLFFLKKIALKIHTVLEQSYGYFFFLYPIYVLKKLTHEFTHSWINFKKYTTVDALRNEKSSEL